jgi:hypothetical protein
VIPPGIISADGHVCEPPNCYIDYIDPKFRDRAPTVMEQPDGTEAFVVPGMKRPVALGFVDGAGFGVKERNRRARTMKFSDVRPAGYIGRERLPFMDQDGLAAEIIYASIGMGLAMHRDNEYKDACMKAYNRWLADMCADAPDRIFGLAQTAILSVDSAIEDFARAKEMGMVGIMTTTTPTTTPCGNAPSTSTCRSASTSSPAATAASTPPPGATGSTTSSASSGPSRTWWA